MSKSLNVQKPVNKFKIRMSVLSVLALVVSVFGGASLVSAQTSDGQARIWARKLDSGNIEFGLRVDSRGGVDETFSNRFLVYGVAEAGVWYASERKLVNLGTSEAGPRVVFRILARRLDSGNVEFGLQVDNDKTWLPDARYFPYSSTAVGYRLYSSMLVVSSQSSASSAIVQAGPSGGGCLNGTAVPNPLSNEDLVSDCEALLEGLMAMRGDAKISDADEPWKPVGNTPPLWSVERDLNVTSNSKLTGWSYVDGDNKEGARVDPRTNRVSWVKMFGQLRGNKEGGLVPASFGNLDELTHLELRLYYSSAGPIPDSWANLTKLEKLILEGISLSGSIPSWIGNLTSLTELVLSRGFQGSGLTGAIPSSIANLSNLEVMHLSRNLLTGEIPAFLGGLSNLRQLYLDDNKLSGSIPSELGNLSKLWHLNLSDNDLSGSIPSELGFLNLSYLDLRGNEDLTGCIPASLKTYMTLSGGRLVEEEAYVFKGSMEYFIRLELDSSEWCSS